MRKNNLRNRIVISFLSFLLVVIGFQLSVVYAQSNQKLETKPLGKEALLRTIDSIFDNRKMSLEDAEWILVQLYRHKYDDVKDSLLMNGLVDLSYKSALLGYSAASREMAMIALDYFHENVMIESEIWAQQLLVDIYLDESKIDSATWLLKRTERRWDRYFKGEPNPYILHSKAMLAEIDGRYLEASQHLITALEIFKKKEKELEIAVAYATLGSIYRQMNMYEKALEYYTLAYTYFEKKSIENRILSIGLEIASALKQMEKYQQSLVWHRKNLALALEMDNKASLARIYMNMGNTYYRLKEYPRALTYLDSSVMIARELGIEFGEFLYDINKADVLVKMNKPSEAIPLLNKASSLMNAYGTPEIRVEFYEAFSAAYQGIGRFEEALLYYQRAANLKDSLNSKAAAHFIFEWEGVIQKERNARELAQLNEAIARDRFQKWMILGGSAAIILVLLVWFRMRFRVYQLKKKRIEEERQHLLMVVDVKNKELALKAIQSAAIGEAIADVSKQVLWLIPRVRGENADKLSQILNNLEKMSSSGEWDDFELRFTQVHEDFFKKLYQVGPELTPTEIKICSLLRLNMSSKEISVLTNRTVATIDNNRASIRKKLGLQAEENLTKYLLSL